MRFLFNWNSEVVSDWKGTKMRDDSFSSKSLEGTERETNWLGI